MPLVLIFTLAVLYDMVSAWSLARRVCKAYPARAHEWKFASVKMGRVFTTLLKGYALIVLAYLVHVHITARLGFDVSKVVAGALVWWQVWSILENESSCNGAAWARVLQRVMVDKTARHFDVDLSGLSDGPNGANGANEVELDKKSDNRDDND